MRLKVFVVVVLFCQVAALRGYSQVRAGSPEATMFDRITAETNPGAKLDLIAAFERDFPQSKVLANVYLIAMDLYRASQDRDKMLAFAEKALAVDNKNVTAMMVLARNHAIDARNLDRAIDLAQRAIDQTAILRKDPAPNGYTAAQWEDYLRTTEESAKQILGYVKAIKAREDSAKSSGARSSEGNLAKPENTSRQDH